MKKKRLITLDVGCGRQPRGDVNVDLFIEETPHREKYPGKITSKNTPNFVRADGQHLPFRDSMFETVLSSETIEHVDRPFLFLSELIRVSNNKVMLTTPHRFVRRMNPFHKQHFTIKWFDKALRKLGISGQNFRIRILKYSYLPHPYFPLVRLPRNILVEVRKKEPFLKEIV